MTGANVYASDDAVGSGNLGDFNWEYVTHASPAATELLSVNALERIAGLKLDDPYEPNNDKPTVDAAPPGGVNSPNLGILTTTRTIPNLVMADSADWFRFQTQGVGGINNSVSVSFSTAAGDLDAVLLRLDGTTVVRRRPTIPSARTTAPRPSASRGFRQGSITSRFTRTPPGVRSTITR